jgi:hypothetical protein
MLLGEQTERGIAPVAVRDDDLEERAIPESLEQGCELVGIPEHRDDDGDQWRRAVTLH